MGKVDCIAVPGFELWFNSQDHLPPHLHVGTAAWEVRVFFMRERSEMIELKWGRKGPSGRDKKLIAKAAEDHRAELLAEWEQKVAQEG